MALPKLVTPKYELTIPSTGKMATYRPYLVKEEKVLMIAMETGDEQSMIRAIKQLIESCVDGVNPNDLTAFDMEYIFTLIRTKSTGETSTVKIPCQKCEAKNEVSIDLSKIRVDGLGKGYKDVMVNDTVGIRLKYPNLEAITEAAFSDTGRTERGKEETPEQAMKQAFGIIEKSIDYVFEGDQIFDFREQSQHEIDEFIDSLSSRHMAEIKDFIEDMPSAVVNCEFDCVECNHHNTMELRGMQNFLS